MNENEYKSVRDKLITAPCVFEKSILALKVQCSKATKKNLAEREVVMCASAKYAQRCNDWLILLRKKSQFALQVSEPLSVLPHSKEMKVQVGGMWGLCEMLEPGTHRSDVQPNVFEVLEACGEGLLNVDEFPFAEIIREVVHFRLR